MRHGLLFRLFPPPTYLAMPAIGVDISDRSIKFAKLELRGQGFRLQKFGELPLPLGVVEGGEIKNPEVLTTHLRQVRETSGHQYVAASLPEEQAYLIKLTLPNIARRDFHSTIELQLEEYVPLGASEVIFDYDLLAIGESEEQKYEVAVSVFPRTVAEQYQQSLTAAGFMVTGLEIEAQAIARAVLPTSPKFPRAGRIAPETALVVDFGKTRTSFFIVHSGVVVFSSTTATIGGESLTTAIQKTLGVDYAEAERLKTERGLLSSRSDKTILFAITPIVSVLRDEIYKFYNYWATHSDKHHRPESVARIVLCGGQATLPGLVDYLAASLKLEVVLANVWINILDYQTELPEISFNQSQRYATSLGLALRSFGHFLTP